MPDLAIGDFGWSSDLIETPSGDLATVDGTQLGTQRVIRRLFTAPAALLWHPDYGFGLPGRIGETLNASGALGLVRAQMFKEAVVSQSPPPEIDLTEVPMGSGRHICNIRYQDRESGAPMLISFDPSAT